MTIGQRDDVMVSTRAVATPPSGPPKQVHAWDTPLARNAPDAVAPSGMRRRVVRLAQSILGQAGYLRLRKLVPVGTATQSAPAPAKKSAASEQGPPRTGAFSEDFWRTREADNPAYVQSYWDGLNHPMRQKLAHTVAALDGTTVLEVGAHCGVNLRALDIIRRYDWLAGVDISPHVVEDGRKLMAESFQSPHALHVAGADDVPFPDARFDVVLVSGLLVCIGPEKIEQVLRELVRVSKRFLVLVEPFDDTDEGASFEGKIDPFPNTTYWVRNYSALLRQLAPAFRQTQCIHLPEDMSIGHLDSILVFEKAASA